MPRTGYRANRTGIGTRISAVAVLLAGILLAAPAHAVTTFSLNLYTPANAGIEAASFAWELRGTEIHIWENWTRTELGFLQFSGLEEFVNYTVIKHITNNTADDWDRFSNELLDPAGQGDDIAEFGEIAPASYVPSGYSHSNDRDGLSFAQNSLVPRTSSVFGLVVIDEDAGRDFIDFYGGVVAAGGSTDLVTYGLRITTPVQEPFLLVQRPNLVSQLVIPEPGTVFLLGAGLAGGALYRSVRRRRRG